MTVKEKLCCEDGWRLILAGGRYNTETEAQYAPVEGELLVIAVACHKARYFIAGCTNLTIVTDHKPLVNYLNDKGLKEEENRRMINLKQKSKNCHFNTVYIKGSQNPVADQFSRISRETGGLAMPEDEKEDVEAMSASAHSSKMRYKPPQTASPGLTVSQQN